MIVALSAHLSHVFTNAYKYSQISHPGDQKSMAVQDTPTLTLYLSSFSVLRNKNFPGMLGDTRYIHATCDKLRSLPLDGVDSDGRRRAL
jgi:hypothetical protein